MINSESAASGGDLVVVSGSPAQIPALAPNHAPSTALAHHAIEALADALRRQPRGIAVVSQRSQRWYTAHRGSFRAWGAPDVVVAKGHHLGDLVAMYLLEQAVLAAKIPPAAVDIEEVEFLDHIPQPSGGLTVVVADGSAGLTPKAPLSLLQNAAPTQDWCEALLGAQMPAPMTQQDLTQGGVIEADMWLELYRFGTGPAGAGLKRSLIHRDHSLGVGRCVALWSQERKAS